MITEEEAGLTKLTVNLIPAAMEALNNTAERLGDTRTDTVNRALQLYAAIIEMRPGERASFENGDETATIVYVNWRKRAAAYAFGALLVVLAFVAGFFASWH